MQADLGAVPTFDVPNGACQQPASPTSTPYLDLHDACTADRAGAGQDPVIVEKLGGKRAPCLCQEHDMTHYAPSSAMFVRSKAP
ncbi:hypothetical protein J1614_008407 [Plenodomus biglobosus]|nr:hypothetical protein J1614_008407 [Plenodomus biglobosus]